MNTKSANAINTAIKTYHVIPKPVDSAARDAGGGVVAIGGDGDAVAGGDEGALVEAAVVVCVAGVAAATCIGAAGPLLDSASVAWTSFSVNVIGAPAVMIDAV